MSGKALVLDANILIRAVLGKRVRELIFDNAATIKFFAPDAQRCVGSARGLATPRPGMPGCSNAARLMKLDTRWAQGMTASTTAWAMASVTLSISPIADIKFH